MKVLYFKVVTHFDFLIIFANLRNHEGFLEVVDFWLVFPLAGLLILKLRRWTYFGFLALLSYNVFRIVTYERYSWPYYSDSPFAYNYLVVAFSVVVFLYFLSPTARKPFFDRRMRWWETMKRYAAEADCKLRNEDSHFTSKVLNISKNGVFIQYSAFLPQGTVFLLRFEIEGESFDLPVEITSRHDYGERHGYGVRFLFPSFQERLRISRVVNRLKKKQQTRPSLSLAA